MKPLQEFWTKSSLKEDLDSLSNPNLSHGRNRVRVNELVMNTVIKYLAHYLRIGETEIRAIRDRVEEAIKWKDRMAFIQDEKEGMQFNACYKSPAPGNDLDGIMCAADIHRTAALFKEIAFGGRFIENGRFYGLELGSGTGILTLAMAVAASRKRIQEIHCVGIEKSGIAVRRSQEVLDEVVGPRRVSIHNWDIRDSGRLFSLYHVPIHYWVSETISLNTPKMDMGQKGFGLSEDQRVVRRVEGAVDPFVEALRVSLDELPFFKSYVQHGATAMFPDAINGSYRPDRGRSTLKLATAANQNPVILERVGEEFEAYEDLGLGWKRWHSPDEVEMLATEVKK